MFSLFFCFYYSSSLFQLLGGLLRSLFICSSFGHFMLLVLFAVCARCALCSLLSFCFYYSSSPFQFLFIFPLLYVFLSVFLPHVSFLLFLPFFVFCRVFVSFPSVFIFSLICGWSDWRLASSYAVYAALCVLLICPVLFSKWCRRRSFTPIRSARSRWSLKRLTTTASTSRCENYRYIYSYTSYQYQLSSKVSLRRHSFGRGVTDAGKNPKPADVFVFCAAKESERLTCR